MGNWWLAVSAQRAHSCITSHAEFFWWNIKSPRWLNPPTAQFGALQLLAFFKTKITFEREEISDHWWDSGKHSWAAEGKWENCVRSRDAYFEGEWGVIVLCTVFLVSCIFINECLYFPYYMAGYFLDRPCIAEECFVMIWGLFSPQDRTPILQVSMHMSR